MELINGLRAIQKVKLLQHLVLFVYPCEDTAKCYVKMIRGI